MSGEARKLHLIEAILKIEDEAVLSRIETLLNTDEPAPATRKTFKDFAGIWTDEEADEIKKHIEEGCGQIDPDEWK
jgi:protein-disulfide isomerase